MRLVIFDLDGTLLTGDTDEYWLRFLIDRGLVDHGEIEQRDERIQARYAQGLASAEEFCFFYLSLLRGRPRAELDRLYAEFMRAIIIPHLPLAALDLLRSERRRADLLLLSTATNAYLAGPIARYLGFPWMIATVPEEGADGTFTGGCVGLPNMRAHKVTRLEAWLAARGQRLEDFAESWFYSDSRNDLPLLERVTHPVAVDPDPELAAHAAAGGWPVLHIHPVAAAAQAGRPGAEAEPVAVPTNQE